MEDCQDGVWSGGRYFSCREGYTSCSPISSLEPDQRFACTSVDDRKNILAWPTCTVCNVGYNTTPTAMRVAHSNAPM